MPGEELNVKEGKELLNLARETIEGNFSGEKPDMPEGEKFDQKKGVFVTLKKDGELMGCVGLPYPVLPLKKAIMKAAKSAAFEDPRFEGIEEEEVEDISIEISTLTMPKACKPKDIELGEEGLICNYEGYSGLLLPQVAIDQGMEKEEFIEAVCKKAKLPKDIWQEDNCKFYKFRCQIFSEDGDSRK